MKPGPAAAYDAAALDRTIKRIVAVAERNVALSETVDKQLPDLLAAIKKSDSALEDAERLSILYDRFVKAGLNLVKAVDELSRLHSFLSGGPDSRPDLTSASEIELRAILAEAVRKLGITDLKQLIEASAA